MAQNGIDQNLTQIGEINVHIKYIRESIESINIKQSNQDEIIRNLQNNCNREERWDMIREDVKELKEGMEDVRTRLNTIEKILESHTASQSTASRLFQEYRDLLWAVVVAMLGAYMAWRWK